MQLQDVLTALGALAPLDGAEDWDNVGLLLGDPAQPVSRVLATIDCTAAVVAEAAAAGAELIVAYHPPIFRPLRRLSPGHPVALAARHGIAVYSPHTALDAAVGGTNDTLAAALGLAAVRPLRPLRLPPRLKLGFTAPIAATAQICAALHAAGAGAQGDYRECRFTHAGTGYFRPVAGAQPAIGVVGEATSVAEERTEMVLDAAVLAPVIAALRRAHPYEEPAYEVLACAPAEDPGRGAGRVGVLAPLSLAALATRVRGALGLRHVLVGGDAAREVRCVAVVAGAGASLIDAALAAGAEALVTGELPHHDVLRARAAGLACIATLHSHSERGALAPLLARLAARLPQLAVMRSACDQDPWTIV